MSIKIIKYIPKVTNARTQYVDIDKSDMLWLQSELIHWLSIMGEIEGHRNEDLRQIMKYWWYKRTGTLPKGHHGQNSPLTFTAGLVNNLVYGTQRDLTTHTMDGIENISNQIVLLCDAIKDLNTINLNTQASNVKFTLGLQPIVVPND